MISAASVFGDCIVKGFCVQSVAINAIESACLTLLLCVRGEELECEEKAMQMVRSDHTYKLNNLLIVNITKTETDRQQTDRQPRFDVFCNPHPHYIEEI